MHLVFFETISFCCSVSLSELLSFRRTNLTKSWIISSDTFLRTTICKSVVTLPYNDNTMLNTHYRLVCVGTQMISLSGTTDPPSILRRTITLMTVKEIVLSAWEKGRTLTQTQ